MSQHATDDGGTLPHNSVRPTSSSSSPTISASTISASTAARASHAEPRSSRRRRTAVHDGLRRVADLLAVAGGDHDRAGFPARLAHLPPSFPGRPTRVAEAAASADAAAAAARGNDARGAPARRRVRDRDDRQMAPRRRRVPRREQGFDVFHAGQATTKPSADEGGKGEYDLTRQAERFIDANRDRPFFLYLRTTIRTFRLVLRRPSSSRRIRTRSIRPTPPCRRSTTASGVLAHLDRAGLRDRTIVIFTSDNGGLHMPEGPHPRVTHNTPFRAGKGYLYEGGLRVPLIVQGPGSCRGASMRDAFLNTDWMPTLLELARSAVPGGLDGVSQARLLTPGKPPAGERTFYWHIPHYTNQGSRPAGAVREGQWKLVEHYDDGRAQLFDLSADIYEVQDLSAAEQARTASLRGKLAKWLMAVDALLEHTEPQCRRGAVSADLRRLRRNAVRPAARRRRRVEDGRDVAPADEWGHQETRSMSQRHAYDGDLNHGCQTDSPKDTARSRRNP